MNGLDDIDFLLTNKDKIEAWEKRQIEIMDTTLRDGEQTSGVSLYPMKIDDCSIAIGRFKGRQGRGCLGPCIGWRI